MNEQLARYFSGEASDSERLKILAWRSETEENAQLFMEAKSTWVATTPKSTFAPKAGMLDSIFAEETKIREIKPENSYFDIKICLRNFLLQNFQMGYSAYYEKTKNNYIFTTYPCFSTWRNS